ncbi:OLC1v1036863C1 [Oldenlandia corymbosa var. corymbosa]|uniref:OLC1v1036863C1 n=1 Tax=Oldenlandia corymbosa var. corymbosa TaxID=529605 RepID=A0AAV1CYE1_OLDCO|nr:OLC1v1036863C1 [Oldenlandia corymbosa var. corymbosa]
MAPIFNMLITLLLLAATVASEATTSSNINELAIAQTFKNWKEMYGHEYKDDVEQARRFEIFKDNLEFIQSFNKEGNHSYVMGLNDFSDLTFEEFISRYGGYKPSAKERIEESVTTTTSFGDDENVDSCIPSRIDWRELGAVTHIKNQGGCGSCWAFSAVGALEGIHQIKTGELVTLSEQELVDCDFRSGGCRGGLMTLAFQYLVERKGITSAENYPYVGYKEDGSCYIPLTRNITATIKAYKEVPPNKESALMKAVVRQPVSVAIAANQYFMHYKSGIFDGPCETNLNHGIVTIGYNEDDKGNKYWIVKNSWGVSWGEKGFGRMMRDIDDQEQGLCGIAMKASYPIV